jgi:glycosyltransferase involved in cell wall biosynthesis
MHNKQTISVIFPAYNEEKNIQQAVRDFEQLGFIDEIIVVDNNSRDKTAELASQTSARVVSETRQGYGAALQRGMKEARMDILVLAEPDGTFLARDILKLLSYVEDFDLVLGTRTAPELIWQGANMKFFLRIGNEVVAKLLEYLFSGPSLTDCGCTFRLIRKEAYEKIGAQLSVAGSHFLPEMVILAMKRRLRVIEIPLNYRHRIGQSKITGSWKGIFTTGTRMVLLILRYRFFPPRSAADTR